MQSKLMELVRAYEMIQKGDHIVCAVSGGADSMALLWSLFLLKEKLGITLAAAHFNHGLRGAESDRDEAFVKNFCAFHDIPFYSDSAKVVSGEKGLEAAARDARYSFFSKLPGKVATAHTAQDNAETVLMHLIRGTGLKGLGGIAPVRGSIIRPLLLATREEIECFLKENYISYIEDSSNFSDKFLRNRVRHSILPLFREENPQFCENISRMALHLRQDEAYLDKESQKQYTSNAQELMELEGPVRYRILETMLRSFGVREPEKAHISLTEKMLLSPKPSAKVSLPGGVTVGKVGSVIDRVDYDSGEWEKVLEVGGSLEFPQWNLRILCREASVPSRRKDCFSFVKSGTIRVRNRRSGDRIHLSGGTKSLKKLFIDEKIPSALRNSVPVLCDDKGIIGVAALGFDLERYCEQGMLVEIQLQKISSK